jgi:hypothetical protein
MTQPNAEDLATYARVKRYLEWAGISDPPGGVSAADSLFAEGPGKATIGSASNLDFPWYKYADGYYEAAELLATAYNEETTSPWVAYPILFLYRHYVELTLKSLIFEATASFKTPSGNYTSELPKRMADEHNLLKLWDIFVGIVADNRRRPMIDDTAPTRHVLAQFTELDPNSVNTRYGLQKDLATPSLQTVRTISVQNVRDLMAKMARDFHQLFVRLQYVNEPWWDEDARREFME